MDVRDAGNTTLVKASQPLNALLPIDVREVDERSTLVKALQPWNAWPPMDVREAGNVTLVKVLQPLNATLSMDITVYVFPSWRTLSGIIILPE